MVVCPGASGALQVTRAFRTGRASVSSLITMPVIEAVPPVAPASRVCACACAEDRNRSSAARLTAALLQQPAGMAVLKNRPTHAAVLKNRPTHAAVLKNRPTHATD